MDVRASSIPRRQQTAHMQTRTGTHCKAWTRLHDSAAEGDHLNLRNRLVTCHTASAFLSSGIMHSHVRKRTCMLYEHIKLLLPVYIHRCYRTTIAFTCTLVVDLFSVQVLAMLQHDSTKYRIYLEHIVQVTPPRHPRCLSIDMFPNASKYSV